ncbi:MAG: STAS domain-containing protein, partial [Pseudomonadota bacterium]|nr:STAS domain-containing protein [Pseudomonadota bacterium]
LLVVSYSLIDFHHIKAIIRASKSETAVLSVTFLATLFLELEFAIYVGVLLSLVIYLNRTSKPALVKLAPDTADANRRLINCAKKSLAECPQLSIIRLDGSLFFGAVNSVSKQLQEIEAPHVLIVASGINFIDVAGAELLVHEAKRRQQLGGGLYFAKMKASVSKILYRGRYIDAISEAAFFDTKVEAIQGIFNRLDKAYCQQCSVRIFDECQSIVPLQRTS